MISRQLLVTTAILFAGVLALSLYVWKLRQRETSGPRSPTATSQHLAPPAAGPSEKVTIWVAHDDSGTLRAESVPIPLASGRQQRAEALMRALLDIYTAKNSSHPLPPGAEIRAAYLVDPGAAVIDVNEVLANGHVSGVLAEELTVASFVETLSANIPGLLRVKILVDGKEGTTLAGHADISDFYDVSQVDELAKQLASQ
jgi:Sporulation and spore germination